MVESLYHSQLLLVLAVVAQVVDQILDHHFVKDLKDLMDIVMVHSNLVQHYQDVLLDLAVAVLLAVMPLVILLVVAVSPTVVVLAAVVLVLLGLKSQLQS